MKLNEITFDIMDLCHCNCNIEQNENYYASEND